LKVYETKNLKLNYFSVIELESDGTITYNDKLQLNENGNGMFTIIPK